MQGWEGAGKGLSGSVGLGEGAVGQETAYLFFLGRIA